MSRGKRGRHRGKIVTFWLHEEHYQTWKELGNKSAFLNLALEQAAGIMAWDLLKKADPERFPDVQPALEEVLPDFNDKHPLDRLTQRRKDIEWRKNSPKTPELW